MRCIVTISQRPAEDGSGLTLRSQLICVLEPPLASLRLLQRRSTGFSSVAAICRVSPERDIGHPATRKTKDQDFQDLQGYSSQQHEATLDKHSSHGGNEVRIRLRSGLHQAAQNGPNWKSCHVASRWEPNTNWSVLGGSARSSERSLSLRQVLGEHGCIQTAPGEG